MTAIDAKVDSLMANLQEKINTYNETVVALEKTKEEIISLQGAINALKEFKSVDVPPVLTGTST
jgi:peptidoglycan hydrolase CwlO-like protein